MIFKLGVINFPCNAEMDQEATKGTENSEIATFIESEDSAKETKEDLSLIQCLLSLKFWTNVLFFNVILLRMNTWFALSGPWLIAFSKGNEDLFEAFTNFLGVALLCGILCAPINGIIVDKLISYYTQNQSALSSAAVNQKVLSITQTLTAATVILFSICTCIPISFFTYTSFILLVVFKAFFFGGNSTYLALLFPSKHFGQLFGVLNLTAAFISLLQFPLGSLVLKTLDGDFVTFNAGLTVGCLIIFVHPIYIYINSRNI